MSRKPSLRLSAPVYLLVAAALLMTNVRPTWAHHSYAMFDHNKFATVSGTIGAIQWSSPHVWVWVYVPKHKGKGYDLYGFESTTLNNLARLGWYKDSLKVGDKISVVYFPLRASDKKRGYFVKARRADGATVIGDTAADVMAESSDNLGLDVTPPKNIVAPK